MSSSEKSGSRKYLFFLTLGALGVVYGDIGTSPLYALRECFSHHTGLPITEANVFGVLSLIIWSLIVVVSLKYILLVLRADNKGEGGELALLALIMRRKAAIPQWLNTTVLWTGLFGASLIYGDGVVTPAISVISAVEGLSVATEFFKPFVIPLTIVILSLLFMVQKRGTALIGAICGPIILIWFFVLAVLGVRGILSNPGIMLSISPHYGVRFLLEHGFASIVVIGAVFLSVTGAEALYADMGHFGRKPIRLGWITVVLPSLILNYFGQGALILRDPSAVSHPFFHLAPNWALYPLIILSTLATVIASQALISGAFSITRQAVQLGFLPRLQILHTSSQQIGQIYVPVVNWGLYLMTIVLVLSFRNSSNLAAVYGFAVSTAMLITTFLISIAAKFVWRWPLWRLVLVNGAFLVVDITFLGANSAKLFAGGWVPLLLGIVLFTVMLTWWDGRNILAKRLLEASTRLEEFIKTVKHRNFLRVPGIAVFMARNNDQAPTALLQNTKHNKVLHEKVAILKVVTEDQPYVSAADRMQIVFVSDGFYRMTLRYGFMEDPNLSDVLSTVRLNGTEAAFKDLTFFLGREIILATDRPGMAIWREQLFASLTSLSLRATAFFEIPSDQVIEIGTQVEM